MKNDVKRNDKTPIKQLIVIDRDHAPSWEQPGQSKDATAQAIFRTHEQNHYLDVSISENGSKSTRHTIMTLDADAAIALYEMLGEVICSPRRDESTRNEPGYFSKYGNGHWFVGHNDPQGVFIVNESREATRDDWEAQQWADSLTTALNVNAERYK